ncbi:ion channel family protein, partial [Mycobacterium xenopi 3993]
MYYATVSLSTTGYGDITPYTEYTRLVNVVVMTPLRIAFLAVLVGTTLEVLSERSRQGWKIQRWRSRVRNHTVVIGYGTKGKTAVAAMLSDEVAPATSSSSTPTKPRWTTRRRRVGHRAWGCHQIRRVTAGGRTACGVDRGGRQPRRHRRAGYLDRPRDRAEGQDRRLIREAETSICCGSRARTRWWFPPKPLVDCSGLPPPPRRGEMIEDLLTPQAGSQSLNARWSKAKWAAPRGICVTSCSAWFVTVSCCASTHQRSTPSSRAT